MQLSVRALMGFMLVCAIVCQFWPDSARGPRAAYYLFVGLTICLGLTYLVGASIYHGMRRRRPDAREQSAAVLALVGVLPFAAIWLFAIVEPHAARHSSVVEVLTELLWFMGWSMYLPSMICLFVSCRLCFFPEENMGLVGLRILWIGVGLVVPVWICAYVLPHLG